jgi:hypothetical protein
LILKFKKVKAGALIFAVTISFIIAMICSMLLMFHYLNRSTISYYTIQQKLLINARSGMNVIMGTGDWHGNEMLYINKDLYNQQIDSVELKRYGWGFFDIAISKAHQQNISYILIAEIGQPAIGEEAVYLADNGLPLIVCGTTKIKGDSKLPHSGINKAYFEGKSYQNKDLTEGEITTSKDSLPLVNGKAIKRITDFFNKENRQKISALKSESIRVGDSIYNSFDEPLVIIESDKEIILDNIYLKGQIIVYSSKNIFIRNTSRLSDILIYAPKIEIEEYTKGNFQAFAYDSILVGSNCDFDYPTVLTLTYIDSLSTLNGYVSIGKKTIVRGSITGYNPFKENSKQVCFIDEDSFLKGILYWKGTVTILKSTVVGGIYCSRFLLNTGKGTYVNYLNDVTVDRTLLPKTYIHGITEGNRKEGIAKWMY